MPEQKKLVLLISKGVSDRSQATKQSRALTLLQAKKTPYVTVDGMDPSEKELRNELFEVSGVRGNYPQFFFVYRDGTTHFVGDWTRIEAVNDSSGLPDEVLQANPSIETWERMFGDVVETFT